MNHLNPDELDDPVRNMKPQRAPIARCNYHHSRVRCELPLGHLGSHMTSMPSELFSESLEKISDRYDSTMEGLSE